MAIYNACDERGQAQTTSELQVECAKVWAGHVRIALRDSESTNVVEIVVADTAWARRAEAQITMRGTVATNGYATLTRIPGGTGTITVSDKEETEKGRIELEREEARRVYMLLIESVLESQARRDAEALKSAALTDATAIRERVESAIKNSRANEGYEVDCMEVRLKDAERTLTALGIASEGGKSLGSCAYDLDIVEEDEITARLRVRWE